MFRIAKSGVNAIILLFALYGFVALPLGKKTAYQHLKAILSTQEAEDAGGELREAGGRMVEELIKPAPSGEAKIDSEFELEAEKELQKKR